MKHQFERTDRKDASHHHDNMASPVKHERNRNPSTPLSVYIM